MLSEQSVAQGQLHLFNTLPHYVATLLSLSLYLGLVPPVTFLLRIGARVRRCVPTPTPSET
jgi:hypothetical protein